MLAYWDMNEYSSIIEKYEYTFIFAWVCEFLMQNLPFCSGFLRITICAILWSLLLSMAFKDVNSEKFGDTAASRNYNDVITIGIITYVLARRTYVLCFRQIYLKYTENKNLKFLFWRLYVLKSQHETGQKRFPNIFATWSVVFKVAHKGRIGGTRCEKSAIVCKGNLPKNLQALVCSENNLSSLDISNNILLPILDCFDNQLS